MSNVLFVAGIALILIGMTSIVLTGTGPAAWRPRFGRLGTVCLCLGIVCVIGAFIVVPPPGPSYNGYAY